jgi:signal peptidase II
MFLNWECPAITQSPQNSDFNQHRFRAFSMRNFKPKSHFQACFYWPMRAVKGRMVEKSSRFMQLRTSSYTVALASLVSDQLSKLWVLFVLDLPNRGRMEIAPFMDFVMVWNRGISYGLFQQQTSGGRWALFAITVAATVALIVWIWRESNRITSTGLALIAGGAIGNGIDRAVYGAVADFVLLHIGQFEWYVFNIADAAIVAGILLLLYGACSGNVRV